MHIKTLSSCTISCNDCLRRLLVSNTVWHFVLQDFYTTDFTSGRVNEKVFDYHPVAMCIVKLRREYLGDGQRAIRPSEHKDLHVARSEQRYLGLIAHLHQHEDHAMTQNKYPDLSIHLKLPISNQARR